MLLCKTNVRATPTIERDNMPNKENMYSIKEFSTITNISTDTLRYYDKIGLFRPSHRDEETGYRYYTLNEFEQIGVIQTLQQLGLTLKEIKEFESNKTFFNSYNLLKKQHEQITNKITDLLAVKVYIDEKIEVMDSIIKNSSVHQISIKEYPERIGYASNFNCKNYREIKIESARIIETYSKSLFISSSYAIHIPKEELENGLFKNNFYCLILDIEKPLDTKFKKVIYPKGKYLTLQYSGTSFEREKTLESLLKYIKDNNLKIVGDAAQLCIVDENLTNLDFEKVNEIQIPVE